MNMDDEVNALFALFPMMGRAAPPFLKCPDIGRSHRCQDTSYAWTLDTIIGHLNDTHRFPRVEGDWEHRRAAVGEGPALPSIHWWLKTNSERFGWDLTVRIPR